VFLVHGLGNHGPALLYTPREEDLLWGLALGGSEVEQCRVFVEWGVGTTKAGVAREVDALGFTEGDEFRGGVIGVKFDLVYCWDDLGEGDGY
jgi:hypothetical protein